MARGSSRNRRRRDSFSSAKALHSGYVTRPRARENYLSPSEIQENRDLAIFESLLGISSGRSVVSQPSVIVDPNVNKPPGVSRAEFLRHKADIDRINSQRAANAAVEGSDLKSDPVLEECIRRQQRREVLFATNQTGRGNRKAPVFLTRSKIKCR